MLTAGKQSSIPSDYWHPALGGRWTKALFRVPLLFSSVSVRTHGRALTHYITTSTWLTPSTPLRQGLNTW